ncbi:MAG: M17 family peptidase N-terminal domain-containing protein [Sandaracinaceae bacterium]|nr:M17 family peptidase N-terminal domain-containing protein [Sandaracinaceae bacterium]
MDIAYLPLELHRIDMSDAEALVLPVMSDERPLRGATSLIDWRLCGRLSRWLKEGHLPTQIGRASLIPTEGRLLCERIIIVGAGESQKFSRESAKEVICAMMEALDGLAVRKALMALPGRTWELWTAEEAVALFAEVIEGRLLPESLVIIDHADTHREMQRVVEFFRLRQRARET